MPKNNLNATDDVNHLSFILLDEFNQKDASSACKSLNETLLSSAAIKAHQNDIFQSLAYTAYAGNTAPLQFYYIDDGLLAVGQDIEELTFHAFPLGFVELPVLCTQSTNASQPGTSQSSASNQISINSGGNTYIGFRNKKSFRFLGIPYANTPQRFVYSTPYTPTGKTIEATSYGLQCAQGSSGSEDCLFLNIQTPYIPKVGSKDSLRPVMFWIHGGGFTGGSGADPGSDGGNLASREDIVVVNINYRLSTLGFLAIPGTNITGNYGIGDQITALDWTIANIASFGGDPNQITIIGESAGAGSVRVLLGSPRAIGKYQGAVAMSNLGGGVALGLTSDYATTYTGCAQSALSDQIPCLYTFPALKLVGLSTVARYVVQDGVIVNTPNLPVLKPSKNIANIPVIFGNVANDGASFSTYPKTPITSLLTGIQASLGISATYAQSVIDSGLFPLYSTGNMTLDAFNVSQRVATDLQFRCIDQATVSTASNSGAFSNAYYYQMQRSINGYDPNNLGGPANNDPNLPYFKLHGADMPWVFGNLGTLRNADDLYSIQLTSGYFGAFVREGDPNPKTSFLRARGYETAIEGIEKSGLWEEVGGAEDGRMKLLDWPSLSSGFLDVPQCAFLNYSLSYYVDGGL
ncbi:hypothetical protein G7Y89_g8842 [Cudoniella acicularis]|uniref:Carboxylic ester hydrolase n=1 Tax=Cudoniella acicularis TaxID=354080 RepID=A0A8H4W369_9HELO|nr:hypothetical protein G7Y89_g8842 [Cudoniella acicularis]